MFSGDFVKLASVPNGAAHGNSDDDWSDQEILLLLEGVEMYDDDWSLIEEHVGTRSSQQCIRKFLELPIEDPYLAAEGSMGPLRYGRIPFEQADNPVMSVVAFLAGVVGPGVAAEAAKTALHELTDGDKEKADNPSETKQGGSEIEEKPKDEKPRDKIENEVTMEGPEEKLQPDSSKARTPTPGADGTSLTTPHPKKLAVPHAKVVRAANLALKSSAKAAKALADAEDAQIRSTLASLIKLTLTKLELKMSQFEELEEILEDERKGLESARMALVGERLNLKRMLDGVRSELAKNGVHGLPTVIGQVSMGTTGQGQLLTEVNGSSVLEGDSGPVNDGSLLQLT
jgi:SWI/SNF related-matrix-associated actin-dependent regulator of chromatin subfamily C